MFKWKLRTTKKTKQHLLCRRPPDCQFTGVPGREVTGFHFTVTPASEMRLTCLARLFTSRFTARTQKQTSTGPLALLYTVTFPPKPQRQTWLVHLGAVCTRVTACDHTHWVSLASPPYACCTVFCFVFLVKKPVSNYYVFQHLASVIYSVWRSTVCRSQHALTWPEPLTEDCVDFPMKPKINLFGKLNNVGFNLKTADSIGLSFVKEASARK